MFLHPSQSQAQKWVEAFSISADQVRKPTATSGLQAAGLAWTNSLWLALTLPAQDSSPNFSDSPRTEPDKSLGETIGGSSRRQSMFRSGSFHRIVRSHSGW